MKDRADNEFRLKVGETVLGLECATDGYAASLVEYFGGTTDLVPHVRLRLEIVPHDQLLPVPSSLFTNKRLLPVRGGEPDRTATDFEIAGGLVSGSYDPRTRSGQLRVRCALTKGELVRVFEQVLYQAFYSAAIVSQVDGFLVHGSGVIHQGAGFLFVGGSGAGKSTAARLSGERGSHVLNDEICLVRLNGEGAVELVGTPFNGLFRAKRSGAAPLRAILLLVQAPLHRLLPVGQAVATAQVAAQIVPPAGLDQVIDDRVRMRLLEFGDRLCTRVPVRQLQFLPDDGFWREIEREFGKGVP
jgi:hypothetical protein